MAALSTATQKLVLDWLLNAAGTPTRPPGRAVGLSFGVPSSVSGSEIATGSGYTRQSVLFDAAVSPAGSASNSAALTFGPFSAGATISGVHIWDSISATVGNVLLYGVLATPRTLGTGDSIVFNAGALITTLA
jgi:hypothetical protein